MENALCFNTTAQIAAVVGYVITGASVVANLLPAPDKTENKVLKVVSKIVHFVAVDLTTAAKK